jgi:hypothetical protein
MSTGSLFRCDPLPSKKNKAPCSTEEQGVCVSTHRSSQRRAGFRSQHTACHHPLCRFDKLCWNRGSLNGNRTRISALRGPRPRPLDDKAGWDHCCPARIRTSISRSRVCCLAIRRRGNRSKQTQFTQFRGKCQRTTTFSCYRDILPKPMNQGVSKNSAR